MGAECGDFNTPANLGCFISTIFPNIIHAVIAFSGVVVLFMFVTAGFKFILAHSDAKQLDSARNTLLWSIIGTAVIVFSFLLLNIIATIFNIPCLTTFTFTNCH